MKHEDRVVKTGQERRDINLYRKYGELKEPVLRKYTIPADGMDEDMEDKQDGGKD